MSEAYKKFDLTGKTAFVTGGGTGLGYVMSRGLARSGAKVMIASRREHILKEAAKKLTEEADGNQVLYTTVDLSDRTSVAKAADYVIEQLGGVDIFIGNAAMDSYEPVDSISEQQLDGMLEVNLVANISLVKAFLPHMRKKKWGRVIFSSSVCAIRGAAQERVSVYSTVKGGLNAFIRSGASEAGHDGITFNSLNLGIYQTDLFLGYVASLDESEGPGTTEAYLKHSSSNTALGRLGDCDEVEGMVQLLASNAGSYITGANVSIDGGISIMLRPNLSED
tara:strand:- start:5824 stop:6660 length:837 start_codon:yes stop_codon:yes gene_type:complete